MSRRADEDRLDLEVLDAVAGLFARLLAEGEELARAFGLPLFVIKALHMMDAPLAMKELGQRMKCDPSFITGIADTLERRGLAARESDPRDRRVKRLVLTPVGVELKSQIEREMVSRLPWRTALSAEERASLLALMLKMAPPISSTGDTCPAEEVKDILAAGATPPLAGPEQREDHAGAHAGAAR